MLDYTLVSTKEEAVRREDVMGKHYQVFTTFQVREIMVMDFSFMFDDKVFVLYLCRL